MITETETEKRGCIRKKIETETEKRGWWNVNFNIVLENGENINFAVLSDATQKHIRETISAGCFAGVIRE